MTIKMTREEHFNKMKEKNEHDAMLILVSISSFATCENCEECIFYRGEDPLTGQYSCSLKTIGGPHERVFSAIKKQLALL